MLAVLKRVAAATTDTWEPARVPHSLCLLYTAVCPNLEEAAAAACAAADYCGLPLAAVNTSVTPRPCPELFCPRQRQAAVVYVTKAGRVLMVSAGGAPTIEDVWVLMDG